jgi:hypothetical protein
MEKIFMSIGGERKFSMMSVDLVSTRGPTAEKDLVSVENVGNV